MAAWILLFALVLGSLALSIWAIVDVAATPAEAFSGAGSSRKKWLMLLVFFTLALDVIGVILAIAYFALVRPKVRSLQPV
ncbi:MAG: DUF2516 family protein [Acidimicrobiales bacterium]